MNLLLPGILVATALAIACSGDMRPNGRRRGRRRSVVGDSDFIGTMVQPRWKAKSRHIKVPEYPSSSEAKKDATKATSLYRKFGGKKIGSKIIREDGSFRWYAYGKIRSGDYKKFHKQLSAKKSRYFNAIQIDS